MPTDDMKVGVQYNNGSKGTDDCVVSSHTSTRQHNVAVANKAENDASIESLINVDNKLDAK